jgi:hydrogenase-4 component B
VLGPIADGPPLRSDGLSLGLAGVAGSLSPLLIAVALVGGIVVVLGGLRAVGSTRTARTAATWGCGRSVQTARMEYTATSFAEPLQRVFDDVLRPDHDIDVSHRAEASYYVEAVRYRVGIRDAFEHHMYRRAFRLAERWGHASRRLQNGNIHLYLAYAMATLVLVLVVAR